MNVYKVKYYTLAKMPDGTLGNLKMFDAVAYIQCENSSKIESLLQAHCNKPVKDKHHAVIQTIESRDAHCIIEEKE